MSYETEIIKALSRLGKNGTENPDAKNNTGSLLGEAFMWDKVVAYAQHRKEACWHALLKEGIIPEKQALTPGEHQLAESPNFSCIAKVTNPIRRFNPDEMAKLLAKSKYKVPISTTKELLEQAKLPGNSTVSFKIVERG